MHVIGILFGLVVSDRIEQKQEWVEDNRYNICNFYQKPKCVLWTTQTDGFIKFSSCQGWSCYKD